MPRPRMLAVLALLVASGGCAEFHLAERDPRPARPSGCVVDLFPNQEPHYAANIVARGTVRCGKRRRCLDELRKQACLLGARGVSWDYETPYDDDLEIYATFLDPAVGRSLDAEVWPPGSCLQGEKGAGPRVPGRR